MADHDYVIDNGTGAVVRADINSALQAIKSLNSGPTEPPVPSAGMLWLDISDLTNHPNGVLRLRNQANNAWLDYFGTSDAITDLQNKVAQNTSDITALTVRMGAAETKNTEQDGRLTTLEGRANSTDTAVAGLQADNVTNKANIAQNTADISSLGTRVTTAEGNITVNQGDIASLKADNTTNKANISANTTAISNLQTSNANKVDEAPNDGKQYARQSKAWTVAGGGGGGSLGEWTYNATTTAPPAAGEVRLNNASPNAATTVYLSDQTADQADMSTYLTIAVKAGAQIYLQDKDDAARWVLYKVANDSVPNTGYHSVPVTLVSGAGTIRANRMKLALFPAASANTGGGGWGPGQLVLTSGSVAPAGTLKANGAAVSRATYADLFAVIGTGFGAGDGSTTFNLPDWRGFFFRAFDDGKGIDPGRNLNTNQNDGIRYHSHPLSTQPDNSSGQARSGSGGSAFNNAGILQYLGNDVSQVFNLWAAAANTGSFTFSNETRPYNTALLACIAYKAGASGGGGGGGVWNGDSPPSDPLTYPFWFNTTLLRLFIYYNDGNSSQWVDTSAPPPVDTVLPATDNRWVNHSARFCTRNPVNVSSASGIVFCQPDTYLWNANATGGTFAMTCAQVDKTLTTGAKRKAASATVQANPVTAALGVNDYVGGICQVIEAMRCTDFVGQPFVIGFKFWAPVAGVYSIGLRERGAARAIVMTFNAVVGQNDVQVQFPALPTDWNIPFDNGQGLNFNIGAIAGSNLNTGTFGAVVSGNRFAASTSVNWAGTVGNQIAATDFFLVPGSGTFRYVPEKAEDERATVERYVISTYATGVAVGTANQSSGSVHRTVQATEPYAKLCDWFFPVTMRAGPTCTCYSPVTGAVGKCNMSSTDYDAAFMSQNEHHASIRINTNSVATGDYFVHMLATCEMQ